MKHNIDEMQKNMINGLAEAAWDLFVKTEAYEEIINSGGIEEDKTYILVRSLYHSLKEAILETQIEKWQKQSKDELIKELQTQSRCLTFFDELMYTLHYKIINEESVEDECHDAFYGMLENQDIILFKAIEKLVD
ncbi:hypothetical protein [Enterococcus bulliens]